MNNLDLLYKNRLLQQNSNTFLNSSDEETSSEEESEEQLETIIKNQYLVISSLDRNLNLSPKTFNYTVKFAPVGDGLEEITTNGVTTTTNFVGQTNNTFILSQLRNIKSIQLMDLVIPNIPIDVADRSVTRYLVDTTYLNPSDTSRYSYYRTIKDLPYLLIKIDEIDNIWDGTNSGINSSIGIMKVMLQPLNIIDQGYDKRTNGLGEDREVNSRVMLHYQNIKPWKKSYYPTPKNGINMFSIQILDNLGNQLNLVNDYLDIKNVSLDVVQIGTSGEYNINKIKIITNKYFSYYEYQEGDLIIFKKFAFDTSRTSSIFNINKLTSFINRTEGHVIREIETTAHTGLCNTLYINFPYEFDLDAGTIINTSGYVTGTIPSGSDALYSSDGTYTDSGKITNTSLQHTMTLKVESLIHDSSIISNTII